MGEGVRHHPARRLALQRVIADRGRRGQGCVDIAGFEEARTFLLLAIDPDAGQAIRLQLDLDLQRVGLGLLPACCCNRCTRGRMPSRFWI